MEAPVTTVPEGTANVHCKDSENRRKKNEETRNNEEKEDHSPDPSLGGISPPAGDRGRR